MAYRSSVKDIQIVSVSSEMRMNSKLNAPTVAVLKIGEFLMIDTMLVISD